MFHVFWCGKQRYNAITLHMFVCLCLGCVLFVGCCCDVLFSLFFGDILCVHQPLGRRFCTGYGVGVQSGFPSPDRDIGNFDICSSMIDINRDFVCPCAR